MSDAVKWGLLAAGLVALIALIVALPISSGVDIGALSSSVTSLLSVCSGALYTARCLINNFLSPAGRVIFSGIFIWLIAKWAVTIAIKVTAWIYHFIFK